MGKWGVMGRRHLVSLIQKLTFGNNATRKMPEYLVGICYHEAEPFTRWQHGVIEDYESSTGLWVIAESPEEAIKWGEQVAEALHRKVNNDPVADWHASYSCWLEHSPKTSGWAHCLDFFQRVHVGEMPSLDQMGTEAYVRWQQK